MTPSDEATFITLWQQGVSYRELAVALHCALGTVGSRAAALAAERDVSLSQLVQELLWQALTDRRTSTP
jgi:DNA-directed RNA polymerase specialized sigma24 family protein